MLIKNDVQTLLDDFPIYINPHYNITRSIASSYPKKFEFSKLVLNSVQSVLANSELGIKNIILSTYRKEFPLNTRIASHLKMIDLTSFHCNSLTAYLRFIVEKCSDPFLLCSYEVATPIKNQYLESLALTLEDLNPKLLENSLDKWINRFHSKAMQDHIPINKKEQVLQEKPGKMTLWNNKKEIDIHLDEVYRNYFSTDRYQDGSKSASSVGEGRGVACVIVNDKLNTAPSFMSAMSFRLPKNGQYIGSIKAIANQSLRWVQSVCKAKQIFIEELNLQFVFPYYSIGSLLEQEALSIPKNIGNICFTGMDVVSGWNPSLSMVEFFVNRFVYTLFVDVSEFPEILCVFLRKELPR